jgi:hypothetical protein
LAWSEIVSAIVDMTGKRFNKLLVAGIHGRNKHRQITWDCTCDCGKQCVVLGASLRTGATGSCGCQRRDTLRENNRIQRPEVLPEFIVCKTCALEKPAYCFYARKKNWTGRSAICKDCVGDRVSKKKGTNPDLLRRSKRRYYDKHKELIAQKHKEYRGRPDYKEKMAVYRRKWNLVKRYGITVQDYDDMLERSNGCCEICKRNLSCSDSNCSLRPAVDHDHETGRVRGILCVRCNFGLGAFGDSICCLRDAIDYLGRSDREQRNSSDGGQGLQYDGLCDRSVEVG